MDMWLVFAYLAVLASQVSGHRSLQTYGRQLLQQCDDTVHPALRPAAITHAPIIDLHWLDPQDQNVLAITKKVGVFTGGLWQSINGGGSWTEQTKLLTDAVPQGEAVDVYGIFTQKSNPQNIFLLGANTYYWVSNDYGRSYRAMQTPNQWKGISIKSFKLHPTQDTWLLLLVKRPNCKALDRVQMECPHDLIFTADMFAQQTQWVNLTEKAGGKVAGFVDFDWGKNICPKQDCDTVKNMKDEAILATMYAKPGDYDQPWDPDVHFVVSDNLFESFSTHVKCGNMFEVIGRSVYLAMANSCPTDINGNKRQDRSPFPQGITLYTSQDAGSTWNQACLPIAVKQEGYELLETHDGTGVIIIVDFLVNNNLPASNVYTAGPHHALFSLSLKNVYHTEFGFATDFAKIEGLPGLYIANQMLDMESSKFDNYMDYDITGQPLVETRITFNGGGRWQRIPAPKTFKNAACNRCAGQPDCYLHLHGMSSWDTMLHSMAMPAVYSNPSAPGLIMASGNTAVKGMGLSDEDGVCTWLSTDGGVTWSDVAVGSYIYEYADFGGFIVMAKHPGALDKVAEEVLFSFDGGKCWQRVPLSEALLLDNIRIEPDGQRPRVIIHGRRCRQSLSIKCAYDASVARDSALEGIMYLVDLEALVRFAPRCGAADFEQWAIPVDADNPGTARCVLGHKSYLQRRKWAAQCFNGGDYKRPPANQEPCDCTVDLDLECDYGFVRTSNGQQCEPISSSSMPFCPAIADHKYTVSSMGKRLVHADTCANLAAIMSDTDGKGGSSSPGGGTSGGGGGKGGRKKHSALFGFFMFLMVTVVLVAGFVGWWVYLATERQRDTVRDLAAGAADLATGLKHWVQDKIRGRRGGVQETDLGYFQPLGDTEQNGFADEHRSLFTLR